MPGLSFWFVLPQNPKHPRGEAKKSFSISRCLRNIVRTTIVLFAFMFEKRQVGRLARRVVGIRVCIQNEPVALAATPCIEGIITKEFYVPHVNEPVFPQPVQTTAELSKLVTGR